MLVTQDQDRWKDLVRQSGPSVCVRVVKLADVVISFRDRNLCYKSGREITRERKGGRMNGLNYM